MVLTTQSFPVEVKKEEDNKDYEFVRDDQGRLSIKKIRVEAKTEKVEAKEESETKTVKKVKKKVKK